MSVGTGAVGGGDGGVVEPDAGAAAAAPDTGAAPAPATSDASPPAAAPAADAAPGETPPAEERQGQEGPGWGEYRRLRKQHKDAITAQETLAQRFEQERAQWQSERAALQQKANDWDVMARAIQSDPEFAAEVENRLAGRRTSNTEAGRAAAAIPPEMVQTIRRLDERLARQEQAEQQRAAYFERQQQAEREQREQEEVSKKVLGHITEKFKKWSYPDELVPAAEGYVARRIADALKKGEDVDLNDVPYFLNDWYGAMEAAYRRRQGIVVAGNAADRRDLPPTPPAVTGQPPINGKPSFGPNDRSTAQAAEQMLRERWGVSQ